MGIAKAVGVGPAAVSGESRPSWDGQLLRLEDVGAAIAVCTSAGDLVGLTPAGRALLVHLGAMEGPLPRRLPEGLWEQILDTPIADATLWTPPNRPDERLGCTRYALGRTHTILLMHEVAGKQREMSRRLHGQRLESMGQLIAAIAHDLRTPLCAILYGAESLGSSGPTIDRDYVMTVIREIHTAAKRLRRTVDGILDYAQLGPRVSEAVSVTEIVQRAQADVQTLARERGQSVSMSIGPDASWALGNALTIEQILVNLLSNSSEACSPGASIVVTATQGPPPKGVDDDQSWIHIRVSDNGPGIPEGVGERVFDPFFTTKGAGTGLGLTTAREAARSQGGDLFLDAVSSGACFVLVLPRSMSERRSVSA